MVNIASILGTLRAGVMVIRVTTKTVVIKVPQQGMLELYEIFIHMNKNAK